MLLFGGDGNDAGVDSGMPAACRSAVMCMVWYGLAWEDPELSVHQQPPETSSCAGSAIVTSYEHALAGISDEGQETVSMARSSAESMTAIINNVLQLSAIEAQVRLRCSLGSSLRTHCCVLKW